MNNNLKLYKAQQKAYNLQVKERSDKIMNVFLAIYFCSGIVLAFFYGTWLIAFDIGGLLLLAYYSAKMALPDSDLYQYVLSAAIGLYMAQFIYQMHGMFEMHFFAFIGSAILITYQNWKLQLPLIIVIIIHHAVFSHLQNIGYSRIYFTQLKYFDLQTFIIHIVLAATICGVCGLWAYQLKKFHEIQILQTIQMEEMRRDAMVFLEKQRKDEILQERNNILESIADAFFAVDKNWTVTYWNNMAEKVLGRTKTEMLNTYLWDKYDDLIDTYAYQKCKQALATAIPVHFENYYPRLEKWYDTSVYPSSQGLSVYIKDITERKTYERNMQESEKRYSDLFHLSPIPKWVFDTETLKFLDVNTAAIKLYGYTKEEFLRMTIKDIRMPEDIPALEKSLLQPLGPSTYTTLGVHRHVKKNGEILQVEIQSNAIMYQGRKARIVIANDITDRMNYIQAIEEQNQNLKDIAWMQSHVVRAPLARIMGLVPLVEIARDKNEMNEVLGYLSLSANELDGVIREITQKANIQIEIKQAS